MLILQFEKPGRRARALADAGISYTEVEQAAVGYCYGDTTCGQRALYQLGMTGIPIYNVLLYNMKVYFLY